MEKIKIEYIPINEIIPYSKNPRKNEKTVDIVAKSIKEFGFKNPIILDKNNEIVAGHTRLKAAIKLGLTEVPIIWADDLTESQVKAYRIMDNKSMEYAEWDFELLKTKFFYRFCNNIYCFLIFSWIFRIWNYFIYWDIFNFYFFHFLYV